MGKRLFLLLLSSFIGIFGAPEILMASDGFTLAGLNNAGITETIPILIEESEPELEPETKPEPTYAYVAPSYAEPAPVYIAPTNNIKINGRTIELGYTDSTAEDAGGSTYAWYYSSGSFIYGHNSGNVFGFLDTAYDNGWLNGLRFTVNMDGAAQDYVVADYRLYDYDASQPKYLWYNDQKITMTPIVSAKLDGKPYKMAIMTCYAGSSKRLVVFANTI